MRSALVLLLTVALGGCSFGDCSFETAQTTTTGGLVVADGRAVGDTLTIAFVGDAGPFVMVEPETVETSGVTPDGAVEVLYDAVATTISGDPAPRPLVAAARGDTVFVYPLGSFDLMQPACSPAESGIRVDVREVLVPEGVAVTRIATVSVADARRAALRPSDRPTRPVTV